MCTFMPVNATGMVLFIMRRSQTDVTSFTIPDEELLVKIVFSCLRLPSCNRSHRWSPTWRGRGRLYVFNYPGAPFTQLQNVIPLPRGSWSKRDGVTLGTGTVPTEIQLAARNISKWTYCLLFICLKWSVCSFRVTKYSPHSLYGAILGTKTECESKTFHYLQL